jgi:hypothetical protein
MGINPSHPIEIVVEDDHPIFRDAKGKRILMIRFGLFFQVFGSSINLRATTLRLKASTNAQSSERVVQFSAFGRGTSGEYPFTSHPCAPLSAKKGG